MNPPSDDSALNAQNEAQALVDRGLAHAGSGNWAEAESLFHEALRWAPDFAAAYHNRSIALQHLGQPEPAMEYAARATALNPDSIPFQINHGNLATQLGDTDTAKAAFLHALQLNPDNKACRLNLAVTLFGEQNWQEAVTHLEHLHDPMESHLQVDYLLAVTKRKLDDVDASITLLEKLFADHPDNIDVVLQMAFCHAHRRNWSSSLEFANRALKISPHHVTALLIKGEAIAQGDEPEKELESIIKTLEKKNPSNATVMARIGYLYLLRADYRSAETYLQSALSISPDEPFALANLGRLYLEIHQYDKVTHYLERELALFGENPSLILNLSTAYLAQGRLAEGWDLNDSSQFGNRRKALGFISSEKDWKDKPLRGQRLRIRPEQGIGDEILFSTCYGDAINEAKDCIIECDPRLRSILKRTYPSARIAPVELTARINNEPATFDFDIECMAGSLPRRYRRSIAAFPTNAQSLIPDPSLCQKWSDRLAALGDTFKIGLCWRSDIVDRHRIRNSYYTHLDDWEELFAVPNVSLINLFYGECSQEIAAAKRKHGINLHIWDDLDLKNDLDDVFALIASLDLVITTQSAVWNMAGAVGKDSLVLMNPNSLLGTDFVPWHPSIEPVTHVHAKPWPEVMDHIVTRVLARIKH